MLAMPLHTTHSDALEGPAMLMCMVALSLYWAIVSYVAYSRKQLTQNGKGNP